MLHSMLKATLKAVLPDPLMFRLSAAQCFWREAELRLVRWMCDADRTALDIGANIGSYTYFMRRYARHVYAYEPIPELAERLAQLLPDVTVRCAAVSDRAETLTLRVPIWNRRLCHEEASVVIDFRRWTEVREQVVRAVRIDDEDTGNIGFMKIDVEQHELPVLYGAISKIRRCRPCILSEVNALIYSKDLPDMFEFITMESYRGFFKFRGCYLPFSHFRTNAHASAEHFGTAKYMENSVVLLPEEKDASFLARGARWQGSRPVVA